MRPSPQSGCDFASVPPPPTPSHTLRFPQPRIRHNRQHAAGGPAASQDHRDRSGRRRIACLMALGVFMPWQRTLIRVREIVQPGQAGYRMYDGDIGKTIEKTLESLPMQPPRPPRPDILQTGDMPVTRERLVTGEIPVTREKPVQERRRQLGRDHQRGRGLQRGRGRRPGATTNKTEARKARKA